MTCYSYIRAITIDPGSLNPAGQTNVPNDDQADYPFLFSGVYSWLATTANGGHVQQASGVDIVFLADSQGQVVLDYERVAYDPSTGAVEFYVRIPNLSHTLSTVIYIAYGSATAADQQNAPGVWRDNYQAVYHFGDGATLNLADSTGNGNNGTGVNGPAAAATLLGSGAGGALSLAAASSQYVDCGSSASIDDISSGSAIGGYGTGWVIQFVLSLATDSVSATQSPTMVGKYNGGTGGWGAQIAPTGPPEGGYVTEVGKPQDGDAFGENIISIASDFLAPGSAFAYFCTDSLNSSTLSLMMKAGVTYGGQDKGRSGNAVDPSPGVPLYIGSIAQSVYGIGVTDTFLDGTIDEVRIRKANFAGTPLNRIRCEFNNYYYTSTFYSVASETAPGPCIGPFGLMFDNFNGAYSGSLNIMI